MTRLQHLSCDVAGYLETWNDRTVRNRQKKSWKLFALVAPLALVIAGCGGGSPSSNPSNGTFSIAPGTTTIDTSGHVQFTATLNSGQPATNVNWVISSGQNDPNVLGQGTIDPSTGLYYPPSALSQDSVKIQIQANLKSNVYETATAVITVTPGFIQGVTPENATVATGGTVPLNAYIAEIGGGKVSWSLSTAPTGGSNPGSAGGSIGNSNCQASGSISSSNPYYTYCTATYTAPTSVPSQAIYAIAAVANGTSSTSFSRLLLNGAGLSTSPLDNQAAQTSAVQMGSSGGNNNDLDVDANNNPTDCASGTLGALVKDQASNLYMLSNNHVFAESDQGTAGDPIIQPGLVDTGCTQFPGNITTPTGGTGAAIRSIGTLQYWVPLIDQSGNVDAALAATSAANVDASGAIIALGGAGGGNNPIRAAAPAAGTGEVLTAANVNNIHVAKSGRTTGLTCSSVDTIDANIKISYYKDAAETQFYISKTFTNQIGMPGNYFSDAGDSGSLVVDTANAQPVGLFYAGSIGTATQPGESFAQPIGEVLTQLAGLSQAPGGTTFTVVGGSPHKVNCLDYDANTAAASAVVSASRMSAARAAAAGPGAAVIDPGKGILGVAAGKSMDHPGRPAVLVYVDQNRAGSIAVPQTIGGLPTRVIPTTASAVASGTAPDSVAIAPGIHLSPATLDAANAVKRRYVSRIMSDPAFFGVGVTQSQDNPAEAALMVFIDRTRTPHAQPATIGGLRIRYRTINPIKVNYSARTLARR